MSVTGTPSYAAQLRVYEPLAAFADAERERWTDYLSRALPRVEAAAVERRRTLEALAGLVPALPHEGEPEAFVTEVDGVTLLCPWNLRVRAAASLASFREDLPDEVADAFVPRAVAEAAAEELEADRVAAGAPLRTHVLTSTWQVPLRWFVLVDPEERTVVLGEPGRGAGAPPGRRTGRELLYRTPMSRARRRVARALAVLRRTVEDGAVTAGVEELGRWLEEFHPRSLVELDYGGLVELLDDAELRQDESARDIADALAALAEGDTTRAGGAYGRVLGRMKALQGVESAN
ncbi:MAG: hypothetical protein JWN57_2323 [Frankiales bacterium]|nr:hypothetical protein [Frankiales bacterium]